MREYDVWLRSHEKQERPDAVVVMNRLFVTAIVVTVLAIIGGIVFSCLFAKDQPVLKFIDVTVRVTLALLHIALMIHTSYFVYILLRKFGRFLFPVRRPCDKSFGMFICFAAVVFYLYFSAKSFLSGSFSLMIESDSWSVTWIFALCVVICNLSFIVMYFWIYLRSVWTIPRDETPSYLLHDIRHPDEDDCDFLKQYEQMS